ncbi:MAG: polyprenyl synthetase family protein [Clostridiales Family XIII bacterium]|jgi:geranylgeranyl diphosphate synthase type II|nr:polyprenyl synthetase family protein [Clostridiales Family XIII bacterium]
MKGFEAYLGYKSLIDDHILDFLPEIDPKSETLYDAMRYSLKSGGKRVRPCLLLAACGFAGGDVSQALPYACAIEYIHTYSLIHDDLPAMDDDDMRRGVPTSHKVFGDGIAILAGDGLLTSAFEAMNKDMLIYFDNPSKLKQRVRAAYEISKGAGCRGMVAGQLADIEAEHRIVSGGLLDYIHVNKTASLIVAAVKAGANIGGGDRELIANLENYAENLGLAFQIADDILDVSGDEKEIGKKTGSDINHEKPAYPALYGLEKSEERLRELTDSALAALEPYEGKADFFVRMAESLRSRTK